MPSLSHGSALDSGADTLMSTATAKIASQCVFDLHIAGLGVGFEQGSRRHDHAVDAVAALDFLLIYKSLLQLAGLAILAESFQRGDVFACQRADRQQARARGHTIHMHCAGTALAQPAAKFWTLQRKIIAQHLEQWRVRIDVYGL